jgi:hypothetical protein
MGFKWNRVLSTQCEVRKLGPNVAVTPAIIVVLFCVSAAEVAAKPEVIVVVGAAGAPEYGTQFQEWSERWRDAAQKASAEYRLVGEGGADKSDESSDRDRLQKIFGEWAGESSEPLWLVFIGHGTFDRHTAKFNLRGPDVSVEEVAEWLKPVKRPTAIVQCASASAPFINRLSGENRVVITATKSGDEQNFARFGQYISATITDLAADLDKDGQVSLLEAYLTACHQVAEFYNQEARLATEHALLDDNGDGLGTPADWFRGLRATQRAKDGATLDGTRAHQFHFITSDRERNLPLEIRQQRDALELEIASLREQKQGLGEDKYFARLEELMLQLAHLYDDAK